MKTVSLLLVCILLICSLVVLGIGAWTCANTTPPAKGKITQCLDAGYTPVLPPAGGVTYIIQESSRLAAEDDGHVKRCKGICDAAYRACLKRCASSPNPMHCTQICHNGVMNCHSWCENNPGADLVKGWTPYFETVWDYFRYYDACPERLPLEYGVI